MRVGVVGGGWVGSATKALFTDAYVYDPYITDNKHLMYEYTKDTTKEDINSCDIVFIGVPTNALPNGRLDLSNVEEVVSWCEASLIVIRSTVNPGDTDALKLRYNKRIVFQPEYLGETPNHPNGKMAERNFMILGGDKQDIKEVIKAYTKVYNANISIRQVSAREAEIIKLTENRAIAFKVMQCHELYLACEKDGTDYYTIRDAVYGDDWRFNLWFTFIYESLGFNSSKCLKKDVPAWCAWAESIGADAEITHKLVSKSSRWYLKELSSFIEGLSTKRKFSEKACDWDI